MEHKRLVKQLFGSGHLMTNPDWQSCEGISNKPLGYVVLLMACMECAAYSPTMAGWQPWLWQAGAGQNHPQLLKSLDKISDKAGQCHIKQACLLSNCQLGW